eukprot:TRINITY_DN1207_c0_g1_i9.p2 TRINITY_DN1207_c0_g1~~TRINITY_DN1207_c0_g1_i9.p2  ORF type:complete len:336 (+),score=37.03 TRINITY_DN1207_c0_g1_i9:1329-2336(+)
MHPPADDDQAHCSGNLRRIDCCRLNAWAFQRTKADIAREIALDDGQCFVATGRRWRYGHHRAAGLVGIVRRVQHVASLQGMLAGQSEQVALDLAEVLGPGDHFLAGVAAFVEADAADFLEVGHLWHEFFLRGQRDQRERRLHIKPAPDGQAGRTSLDAQFLPKRSHCGFRGGNNETVLIKADDRHTLRNGCCHGVCRAGQSRIGQGFLGLRAGKAEHDGAVSQGGKFDFGSENKHLQAFLRGLLQIGGKGEQIALTLTPGKKAGLHAPLGRTPAGMLCQVLRQMVDVAGELAVQERLGIFTGGFDQPKMSQRHDNGILRCGLKFAGGIAKIEKLG